MTFNLYSSIDFVASLCVSRTNCRARGSPDGGHCVEVSADID